jgi:hypothetical protein
MFPATVRCDLPRSRSAKLEPQYDNTNRSLPRGKMARRSKGSNRAAVTSTTALSLVEASLKRNIRRHLKLLGFTKGPNGELVPPAQSKEAIRALHASQRAELLRAEHSFIAEAWPRLKSYFAAGTEVDPERISPKLELVKARTPQADLFRLGSLLWSVPVSAGYGRRIRFLVWDHSNSKLMGLIALGDPVFNLRVRDQWVGWSAERRKTKLVNVLDAYVLGAVPPYNSLLCGKVVASLVCTADIRDVFTRKYGSTKGSISDKYKRPRLCLITTSSALGRSSIYNRLTLNGKRIFQPIGYTEGWGHFHISNLLFEQMRRFLKLKRDTYSKNYRYGDGPNWRLRASRRALDRLGLNPDLLKHGVRREVFVSTIAQNAQSLLRGKSKHVRYTKLPTVSEIGARAVQRWVLPRATLRQEYRYWTLEATEGLLNVRQQNVPSQPTSVVVVQNSPASRLL